MVSNTGINAITSNNNGISKYKANPDITPPSIREPVSPINTLAGWILNIRNPKTAPMTILANIDTSYNCKLIPIIAKQVIIIAHTLDDKPSIPSVKLTAFVAPNMTRIANGIYTKTGIPIYVFIIGIYVCVSIFNPYTK